MHKIPALLFFLHLFCSQTFAQNQCENFQNALEVASHIRGLKVLEKVNCKVVSSDEFSKAVNKQIKNNTLNDEKIYKMIGLIPESYDYQNCFAKNDLESVMASYLPSEKAVYIPSNTVSSFDLLVHEATHALQDQHFNLEKISKRAEASTDSYFSFLAFVEGDAELVQNLYLKSQSKQRMNMESQKIKEVAKNSCEIPQALLFVLDFPYFWGARYVRTLKSIDQSFHSYPRYSTEVLYPHKKIDFKIPRLNENNQLAREQGNQNYSFLQEDTLGEYLIRCMLRELIGSRFSVIAGHGWSGDKVALYKDKEKYAISWIINTKNEVDAKELYLAFKKSLEKRLDYNFNTEADTIIYGNKYYSKIYLNQKSNKVRFFVSE